MADHSPTSSPTAPPIATGYLPNAQYDLVSGFLVFLIALPLCLGIAAADNFPPITGIWTAVLGGLITTFISNSQMTIKGPAAGLIVIVLTAVTGFESDIVKEKISSAADRDVMKAHLDTPEGKAEIRGLAYRATLGVAVVAGIFQILFGLFRGGFLAEICPMTPVHALLASIGIIIMFKQAYPLLGLKAPGGEAIESVIQFPGRIPEAIPNIAIIGLSGLAIMIIWSLLTNKTIKKIPAQIVVLLVCVPIALGLGIDRGFFVAVPDVLQKPESAIAFPDFSRLGTETGINSIVLFALIGSLESLVSAKAVDLIDPWKRKTDLNRDMLAVGVANTLGACVGAPPMISEIVRSKANIDNGARTRFADFYHAIFLLLAAVFLSSLLAKIPLAALAAMLVFTGYRLAHPREFFKTYQIGPEQLVVFLTTIVVILATDLLKGFFAGIAIEIIFHLINGTALWKMVKADVVLVDVDARNVLIRVRGAAVFSNWLGLRSKLAAVAGHQNAIVDLSETTLVDHTIMEKLHEFALEFAYRGRKLEVRGLQNHKALSNSPVSARKQKSSLITRTDKKVPDA